MRSPSVRVLATAAAVALAAAAPAVAQARAAGGLLASLPARIVPNDGQWRSGELYRMRVGGDVVFLERDGWSFWLREPPPEAPAGAIRGPRGGRDQIPPPLRAVAVRMTFLGAGAATLVPEQPLPGVEHHLVGPDRGAHRRGLAGFAALRYAGLYPGVDVHVRDGGGHLEYDLLLAPGADLAQVRVGVAGATAIELDPTGALILRTPLGPVRQPPPATWTVTPAGDRRPIECRYVRLDDRSFGFAAPGRDPAEPLVIDPQLLYSTYVGGSGNDLIYEQLETATGRILLCGVTESVDFPNVPGAVQAGHGGGITDGFLLCIDPSLPPPGQLVWSTYVGGSDYDELTGIAVLPGGGIAFTGTTKSNDLPTGPGALQPANAGRRDVFVGVIDATGSSLTALSYFGGADNDLSGSVDLAPTGELYLVGQTRSLQLPTTPNAFAATHSGGTNVRDGYIARVDAALTSLSYCSYFGGSGDDWLWCGDCDGSGVLTMISGTNSTDFPVTPNAYDTTYNGGATWWSADCGVVRFDPNLPPARQLLYGTYLGHAGGQDYPFGVRMSPQHEIVVSGTTSSRGFPTTPGAYQRRFQGNTTLNNQQAGDGFVAKIDPARPGAAGLVASTFFGGPDSDQGLEAAVDSDGAVTLCGWTHPNNVMPTTPNALRRTPAGEDGYVARLSPDLGRLLYATYVGGTGHEDVTFLDRHADGVVTGSGNTLSTDLPIRNGFQGTQPGARSPFVARIATVAAGVSRYGAPSGGQRSTIHALADATPGNARFGLACSAAPPGAQGALLFCWQSAPGAPLLGLDLWVDLGMLAAAVPATADGAGEHTLTLPLPPTPIGTLYAQYVWIVHLPTMQLCASDALQIN